MGKLTDKVAVVTGAAFGNGRGMALRFAEEGADVVIADVHTERMEETARLVRERHRRALVHRWKPVLSPARSYFRTAASQPAGMYSAMAAKMMQPKGR